MTIEIISEYQGVTSSLYVNFRLPITEEDVEKISSIPKFLLQKITFRNKDDSNKYYFIDFGTDFLTPNQREKILGKDNKSSMLRRRG